MSGTVLDRIAVQVRARLEEDRKAEPVAKLEARAAATPKPAGLERAFSGPGTRVIAEVKLASPSEGDIAKDADPVAVASGYLEAGAAALSILTERDSFKGNPEYLRRIRAAHPGAALLMKDFVVDEYQILQGRANGADAVLLIVALLGGKRTGELAKFARGLGLSTLVEVHNEAELEEAGSPSLLGVNNRNLKTLKISLETSERLAARAPKGSILIAESGIEAAEPIARLKRIGYRGFLIGTHFMRQKDPGAALGQLLREAGG